MSTDTPEVADDHSTIESRIIAEFGGVVDETRVWLGVYGDNLDPDEVSEALGVPPTRSHHKGEARRSAQPWPHGAWILMREGNPGQQPDEILGAMLDDLPSDPDVWTRLRSAWSVRLTFGLHLGAFNRGFDLSPPSVGRLASVGAIVGFDIYCDGDDLNVAVE